MMKTGAQVVIEKLLDHDVNTVFGYPGGAILPLYDELYKQSDRIHHVLTSHEQGAAHAADGYARASGKVGVCFATSGPGATNLVTGIATAFMDSSPVVFLTANVLSSQIGTDSFQEVDIVGITMPATKYNWSVRSIDDLADTLDKAFALAQAGRPGPVLVDIPKDLLIASVDYQNTIRPLKLVSEHSLQERTKRFMQEHGAQLDEAAQMIRQSKRPFLLLGGGAMRSGAYEEIRSFATILRCPVSCTLMAMGVFPGSHPQYAGSFGMHGSRQANIASSKADLFIAIGTRFNDRISGDSKTLFSRTKLLHIDIDAAEIDKNVPSSMALIDDAAVVLRALTAKLADVTFTDEWLKEALFETEQDEIPQDRLTPRPMMRALRKTFGDDTLVATDVGQHQMWVAQHCPFDHPGKLITSGGLGTMGFGLGAAIGAALARPDQRMVLVTGDGSFRMNLTELSTAVHEGIPLVVLLLNNSVLGMVRQWQTLFYDHRYSATDLHRGPHFPQLAKAYGMEAFTVTNQSEYEDALQWAYENVKPTLIECIIDQDEMVRPMVAQGNKLTDFTLE